MLDKSFAYRISKLNYNVVPQSIYLPAELGDIRFKYYEFKINDLIVKKNSISSENNQINFDSYSDLIKDLDLIYLKRSIKDWLDKENKKNKKNVLNSNFACSPDLVVYTLPSNLESLGKMTCIEYLTKYTKLSRFRTNTASYLFNKYKADDLNPIEEPFIERMDLLRTISDFHGNSFIKIEEMMTFLDLNETKRLKISDDESNMIQTKNFIYSTFKFDEFKAIIAFSERYNSNKFSNKNKNHLEYLDFCVVFKKIEYFKDNKKLENLLKFLFDS